MGSTGDSLLQSDDAVRRVYLGFPEMSPQQPWRPMFAVGVFAGLRPGRVPFFVRSGVIGQPGHFHCRRCGRRYRFSTPPWAPGMGAVRAGSSVSPPHDSTNWFRDRVDPTGF